MSYDLKIQQCLNLGLFLVMRFHILATGWQRNTSTCSAGSKAMLIWFTCSSATGAADLQETVKAVW